MSRDKQNIKTTDWLTRGIPEEQLEREKREAVLSAYLQLCMTYDEETKGMDFDATAEKLVAEGYAKASDVAREVADGIINEILPKHLHGHNEKALQLSFAISNFITNHKEWGNEI